MFTTPENQAIPQDVPNQQSNCFAVVSLAIAIIITLIVPPFFAIMNAIVLGKFFAVLEFELPLITTILVQMSDTVVTYWYLFLLLLVLFVPLALWLLTKLSTKILTLILVFSLAFGLISTIIASAALYLPFLRITYGLAT